MAWFLTARIVDQPGRCATALAVTPPSAFWLSDRKISCGLALTMYSWLSSGNPDGSLRDVVHPQQAEQLPDK